MIAEAKIMAAPIGAAFVFFAQLADTLPDSVRLVLDLAALAVLLAGFLVLGKLRAQAAAAEGAAEAWKSERDALALRVARHIENEKELEHQIADLRTTIAQLEARPTLESMEQQLQLLTGLMRQTAETVQALAPQST